MSMLEYEKRDTSVERAFHIRSPLWVSLFLYHSYSASERWLHHIFMIHARPLLKFQCAHTLAHTGELMLKEPNDEANQQYNVKLS